MALSYILEPAMAADGKLSRLEIEHKVHLCMYGKPSGFRNERLHDRDVYRVRKDP